MRVDFYHLTVTPLERVLPKIADKVVSGGERLLVVSAQEAQRDLLDQALWAFSPESFLPHAQAGRGEDSLKPILIGEGAEAANGASNIALADGVWREEALGFARTFHFFSEDEIAAARTAWRQLGDVDGVERRYWKQNERGGWDQAA